MWQSKPTPALAGGARETRPFSRWTPAASKRLEKVRGEMALGQLDCVTRRLAGLDPMVGYYGWPPTVPENICNLPTTPVWTFHGAEDEQIPLEAEQKLVDALKSCGGDVQFAIFSDVGHDLDAKKVYPSELYEW